jgi:Cu+-exporting ATPase
MSSQTSTTPATGSGSSAADAPERTDAIELAISGMTCASCANRIERKLNKLDGVVASVNYSTEKAKVSYPAGMSTDELLKAVDAAGYSARLPQLVRPAGSDGAPGEGLVEGAAEPDRITELRNRLLLVTVLTIPVIAMSMITPLQFRAWQWLALTMAAPVVLWGAGPFHKAAWKNARNGAASMDTLISVGTLAALAWSLYALFFGTAGELG